MFVIYSLGIFSFVFIFVCFYQQNFICLKYSDLTHIAL
ncbi:putative membrane protein [Chlamydia muridarum]|nr:putative membrane protein [Chlamydia muridarum]KDU81745.1 putative membrane protein [Chlamydia muridarum]KDU82762.1 putative membrane protein [Chlamydia muridarum]KDU83700.1 putative membrane protein [Chlamydia muridarum]KDU84555.1 putative membrane protein [Chlamydia muridarum]